MTRYLGVALYGGVTWVALTCVIVWIESSRDGLFHDGPLFGDSPPGGGVVFAAAWIAAIGALIPTLGYVGGVLRRKTDQANAKMYLIWCAIAGMVTVVLGALLTWLTIAMESSWVVIARPVALLAMGFGLGITGSHVLRRTGQRVQSSYCHNCGYDLRASPRRCPECGTEYG